MRSGTYLECFKAYDVRGRIPDQLNPALSRFIGRAYAALIEPKKVAVGHDVRLTSPELAAALCEGLNESGVDVVDIGLVGTEEVYFATCARSRWGHHGHGQPYPRDYNGMKFTREEGRPISADTGLLQMEGDGDGRPQARDGYVHWAPPPRDESAPRGTVTPLDTRSRYVEHLLTYIDVGKLRPLKIVVNAGNGGAGPVVDLLEEALPFEFIKINHAPGGAFPSGVPNPMLPENRAVTADAVVAEKADLGIAWDGDFDRCSSSTRPESSSKDITS